MFVHLQVYRIFGQMVVFYPTDSLVDFYTSYDVMTLIDTFKVHVLSLVHIMCEDVNIIFSPSYSQK